MILWYILIMWTPECVCSIQVRHLSEASNLGKYIPWIPRCQSKGAHSLYMSTCSIYFTNCLSTTGLEQLLKVEGLNSDQELNSDIHKDVLVMICWGAGSLPSI